MRLVFGMHRDSRLSIGHSRTSSFFTRWNRGFQVWSQVCLARHHVPRVALLIKGSAILVMIHQLSFFLKRRVNVFKVQNALQGSIYQTNSTINANHAAWGVRTVNLIQVYAQLAKVVIFLIKQASFAFWNRSVKGMKA